MGVLPTQPHQPVDQAAAERLHWASHDRVFQVSDVCPFQPLALQPPIGPMSPLCPSGKMSFHVSKLADKHPV